jgi:hypothetical protein
MAIIFLARLTAIQAASDRVLKCWFSKLTDIVMVSVVSRDVDKFGGAHSMRRAAAMASLNVGSFLQYHAVAFGRMALVVVRAS